MSTLTGRKIANSYKNLLQVETSNTDLDTSLKNVQTGAGNNTPLQLSTDKINLNGTIQINGTTLSATAAELNAITDLTGTTGIVAVSAGNVNGRTIVVGSPLSITNANGTEGNPTINLASSGVSAATYGPMVNFTVDNFGRITDVTATTTISANAFIGGTLSGSALTVENNTSIGGNVVIEGTTNMKAVSATDVTFNNLTVGTKITTDTVTATTVETSILRATTASISDLTAGTLTFNNLSTTNLFAVSANVTRLFKDGESVATSAEVATLSATMATSIANRTSAITSINSVVTDLSATMAASITNKTAGIPAAFVSVNAVIINLSSTLATSIANVSALSKTNLDAITSINTVVGDLSSTLATSIGNRTSAITSINTVVGNLSSTLATSISNRTSAITSINTVITNLSATLATSIANVDITSVSAFTVNALTVVSAVNGDLTITGNINADGGEIHDFEFGSMGFSNITGLIHSSLSTPTTQYSLLQSSIGKTYLNSAIGNTLDFRIGNTTYAKVDVGTFNVQSFADNGPTLNLISNDPSDVGDFGIEATINYLAENSASEQTTFAQVKMLTDDVTDGTEDGRLIYEVIKNGTLTDILHLTSTNILIYNTTPLSWYQPNSTNFVVQINPPTPTASRNINLPDASGEVIVNSGGQTMTSHLQFADNAQLRIGDGNDLVIRHDGNHSLIEDNGQGDLYIRASDNLNIQADNGLGGWQNAIQTQFTGTNAKVAFFNGGTQVFSTLPNGISIDVSGGIRFEGATADGSETFLQVTDPTADRTITLPDASGTVHTTDYPEIITAYGPTTSPRTFKVTVQTPSGYYPYAGDGSGLKFHIDGMANPALELHGADQATASSEYIYRFDQSDSSNSGHPLRFYLEANKTTAYTVNVTTNGTPGSAGAYTQIAVDQETPKILYYQCSNHDYMGNYITAVNSNTFSNDGIRVGIFDGNNHDRLELFQNTDIKHTASGTGNSTTLTFNTASSNRTITFPDATGTVLTTGNSDTPSTTTASSDADFVLIDDGGTMKKITPSNLGIGGSGSITVQDEGSSLSTAATTLDFVGAGVVASGTGATKTITIAGGGSGITVQDEGSSLSTAATTLNFVGSGVTASGTGATKTITISGGGSGGGTTSETWGASLNGKLNMYTASKTIFIGSQDNATSATEPSVNATVSAVDGVVIGYNAGKDLTSGHSNIFIGRDAGESNTTGYGGTFIGYQAGKNVTTPHSNTIIGYAAGRYTTTGVSNTLIGYMAGTATYQSAGTMANNTAVGYVAGKDLTTGYKNSILGGYAGENISTGYHNSILGYEALKGATSGTFGNQYENVAVGYQALYSSGSGYHNSVLGTKALFTSNSGTENVAIGFNAGYQATSSYNVIIGSQAGTSLTSGASHTFVGEKAGYHFTTNSLSTAIGKFASWGQTGQNNVSVGYQAASGSSSTLNSGSYNVSVGYRAFYRSAGHSSSTHNCCVGYNAGAGIYSGDYNTFLGNNTYPYYNNSSYGVCIGFQAKHNHQQCTSVGAYAGYSQYLQSDFTTLIGNYAGYDLDGGDHCTFVGYSSGYGGGTGNQNVGVGNYSVDALTSGYRNTGMGYGALSNISSGDDNAGLGYNAGEDFTTGSKNTFCGAYAGGNFSSGYSGSNNTVIGYAATPSSTTVSNEITLGDSNVTSLRCQVQTISSLSDQRDKTAIEDLDLGLDFIKAMRPVKFAWNRRDGKWHGKKEVGFIAQELHEVEMDFNSTDRTRLVSYENPSKLEARPMNTYPILVKAIQELSAKVDSLQARITELEGA